jgi:hypothetical protein
MTKTTNPKRSTQRPDKLAMVGKTSGVQLSEAQLGQVAGGLKQNTKA